jgi:hypothetical protein
LEDLEDLEGLEVSNKGIKALIPSLSIPIYTPISRGSGMEAITGTNTGSKWVHIRGLEGSGGPKRSQKGPYLGPEDPRGWGELQHHHQVHPHIHPHGGRGMEALSSWIPSLLPMAPKGVQMGVSEGPYRVPKGSKTPHEGVLRSPFRGIEAFNGLKWRD